MEPFNLPLSCPLNCSGHGSCTSGTCICEVHFTGGSCRDSNRSFFLPFGVVFYLICITSIIQLILCIRADFIRLKKGNIGRAFRLTIQKLLYLFIIIATGSRALYFCIQEYIPEAWKNSLLSSYYPFIISGYSIIICFWAEIFHIGVVTLDRSRFLTRTSVACAIFNVFVYMLLFAQLVSSKMSDIQLKESLSEFFNITFAFLMFFVLVFFLIYGVEIFCKLKGEFTNVNQDKDINWTMAFQSRLGIVAQGVLQLATTFLLLIDVVGRIWKDKVAVGDRNILEITFRVLELGVAMWFPCVLWNAHRPEELWLLNPKKLLLIEKPEPSEIESLLGQKKRDYSTFQPVDEDALQRHDEEVNCWICYDPHRTDAGLFISPCKCKGDMSTVHHGCLKKWLLESIQDIDQAPCCKICKTEYRVSEGYTWISTGFHKRAWLQSIFIVLLIIGAPIATGFSLRLIRIGLLKVTAIGGLLLCEYMCFRLLGFNFVSAVKRARIQAFKVLDFKTDGAHLDPDVPEQATEHPSTEVPDSEQVKIDTCSVSM
eukprot:gene16181-17807_t